RVSRLVAPVTLPEIRRYTGCVSWVKLDEDVDVASANPVLEDVSFAERVAKLRSALGEVGT
ncbi:MAG TPA: DUF1802 family protein, partial [Gemmatimonadaceae bacterium]|nr:DUF1802 family protein [Gemmatimonadaceae bacterium]